MGTQKTFSGSLASHDERIELDCSTSVPSPDASSEKVSLQPRCPLEDDDIFEAPPTDSADSRVTHVMPQATEECEVGVPPTDSSVTHVMPQPTEECGVGVPPTDSADSSVTHVMPQPTEECEV